jgi:serine/threonine protein kinase
LFKEDLITEQAAKGVVVVEEIPDTQKIKANLIYVHNKTEAGVLLNHFKLNKEMGKDLYERNYIVEHISSHELFQMKELKKGALLDTDKITSDQIEKEVLKNGNNPFLSNPLYVFQAQESLYLLFKFMRGNNLAHLLDKEKRISEPRALFYIGQIALALAQLHSNQIIYRTLRLDKVMIDEKGYISLNDFGIYRFIDDEKRRQQITNTAANSPIQQIYLAPENFTGDLITKSVDWWSLGIILYELLVGIPPFYSQDQQMLVKKINGNTVTYPDPLKYHILVTDMAKDLIYKVTSFLLILEYSCWQNHRKRDWVLIKMMLKPYYHIHLF